MPYNRIENMNITYIIISFFRSSAYSMYKKIYFIVLFSRVLYYFYYCMKQSSSFCRCVDPASMSNAVVDFLYSHTLSPSFLESRLPHECYVLCCFWIVVLFFYFYVHRKI